MDIFGVKPSGFRHPLDPVRWSKQTWGFAAAIVLLALLFAMGLSRRDDAPAPAAAPQTGAEIAPTAPHPTTTPTNMPISPTVNP